MELSPRWSTAQDFFSLVRSRPPLVRARGRRCANAGCGGHGTGSAVAAVAATGSLAPLYMFQGKNVPVLVRLISRFSCPRSGPIEGEKLNVCDNAPAMLPLSAVLLERIGRACI